MTLPDKTAKAHARIFPKTKMARTRSGKDSPDQKIRRIIREQNIKPIHDPKDLQGNFWPKEESADDFVSAYRQWRREG